MAFAVFLAQRFNQSGAVHSSHYHAQAKHIKMLGYVTSFAAVGFGVRCYQLAILKRNVFDNLGGHLLSATAFGGLGYYLYNSQEEQRKLLLEKKDQLLRMREREATLSNGSDDASHH